jgi:hypothetical protein
MMKSHASLFVSLQRAAAEQKNQIVIAGLHSAIHGDSWREKPSN